MTASVFTGSFVGDGSGLYGISASGVTGLNLSQISTGSVTASVSPNGFNVNSNTSITGTLKVTGTIVAEQIDVTIYSSSVLYQSGSTRFGDSLDDNHDITGSVNITGSISLNGQAIGTGKLDETVFNSYTASNDPRVSSLETSSGSLNSFSSSINSFTSSLNSYTSALNSYTSSNNSRVSALEVSSGSLNVFTSSINTTIKNKLDNDGVISGSIQVDITGTTGYSTFSSSLATISLSQETKIGLIETSTASLNTFSSSALSKFASIEITTSSLNVFSSSVKDRLTYLETSSGSIRSDFNTYTSSNDSTNSTQNNRLDALESTTGSLNTYTSSTNTRLGVIENTTSSINNRLNIIETSTSSLNSFTSSIDTTIKNKLNTDGVISGSGQIDIVQTTNYNTFSSSLATTDLNQTNKISAIESTTASLNIFTSSTDTRLNYLESTSGSLNSYTSSTNTRLGVIENTTSSLNTYTSSTNTRLGVIESTTASLNSHTSSANGRLTSLETASGSIRSDFNTFTSSYTTVSGSLDSRLDVLEAYSSSQQVPTASYALRTTQTDVYCQNNSGYQINKGQVVRIVGAVGDNPLIATASYENDNNSANTLGIATENIANGSNGLVITEGVLLGVNTLGMTAGDLIFLGSTGSFINTSPVAPLHGVRLGEVLRVNQNNGSIYVRIDNGIELNEAHDVAYTNISQGDLLVRNSGGIWTNTKQLNGSYALTGSLTVSGSQNIIGTQTVSGSLIVLQDLQVFGSSSITYVTASQLALSTSFISVNVFEPAERFGGIKVYDSGSLSHQATASLAWDSQNNRWVYQNASGSSYSGGMLISGPRNSGSLGDEPSLTSGKIPKSVGGDHIDNSIMNETAGVIYITGSLSATGTVYGTNITAIEATTSSLNSYTASNDSTNTTQNNRLSALETSTSSLNTFTSSAGSRLTSIETSTSSLNSHTSSTNTRLSNIETSTGSLNSFTSSTNVRLNSIETSTGSLNSHTSSTNSRLSSIETSTGSLNSYTSSTNTRLSSVETATGSLNSYTSSTNVRLNSIETSTGSLNSFTSSINTTIKNRLNAETVISGSAQVVSALPAGTVSGSAQVSIASTSGFSTYLDQAVKSGSTVTFNFVNTNRLIQTAHSTTLSNSSYNTEAAVYANAGAGTNIYPGYGFHKSGELGVFLYATNRSTLRLRADDGGDYKLWHDGNDGAGTGLDSDLLDGQHGSYYATDSSVVKLTGTQTIGGEKTFSDRIIYSKPLYRSFDTFAGADDSRRIKTYSGVLVAASEISGAEAYTIIDTNVPQDNFQMGGFTIEIMMDYENTNNKTKVDLAGYWNPENNGGFTGWEAHFSNPGYTPTIRIARKTATGNVSFIITNSSASYQIIVARDLWLGYNESTAESTEKTWGDDWAIIQSANTTAYANIDTVVNRSSSVSAGTGISVNKTTNDVTVTNTGTLTVAGTSNQVLVNGSTAAANGNITLSLPQSIGTSSSPTFSTVSATTFTGALSGNATTASSTSTLTSSGTLTTQAGSGTLIYTSAIVSSEAGIFSTSDNSNAIITLNRHPGAYYSQLGFNSSGGLYYRSFNNTSINTTQCWQTVWTSSSLTNLNQLTNGPGYITGISFANVSSKPTTLSGLYYNDGVKRVFSDPRWNESGYDGDLGTLHIYSTTAAGANYGRAGIALYNGSAYQYLTTKASTTGLFANNSLILTAGNYTSYAMQGAGYSANQNLNTNSTVNFGNLRVGTGGSTNGSLMNVTGEAHNQINVTTGSGWGLLIGYCNEGSVSGYHGPNSAALINVNSGPIHLGTNNSSNVQISSAGHFHPTANNTYDCGTASLAWRNVYTNDLHLSNMNKPEGNDVDGTNGNWTIQEGAENLYIINNNNGKKFKISLEEII